MIVVLLLFCSSVTAVLADDQSSDYFNSFSPSIALGISIVILGCTIDNVGITLQKLAHRNQQSSNDQENDKVCYCADLKWTCGLLMYLSGNALNAVGLPMCPQSLYSALGSFSVVINVLTSRLILKEKLTPTISFGTAIIMVGSLFAVIFGDHQGESYTLDSISTLIVKPAFLGYFAFLVISVLGLTSFIVSVKQYEAEPSESFNIKTNSTTDADSMRFKFDSISRPSGAIEMSEDNLLESPRSKRTSFWKLAKLTKNWKSTFLCVSYPLLAGMIGSVTLLSAKVASEIIKSASSGNPEFSNVSTYFFFVTVVVLGATQIHVLNLGLKKFDQIIVIPVFTIALETFSILIGIIFFEEYKYFDLTQSFVFPLAILLTFCGVYITAMGEKKSKSFHLVSDISIVEKEKIALTERQFVAT